MDEDVAEQVAQAPKSEGSGIMGGLQGLFGARKVAGGGLPGGGGMGAIQIMLGGKTKLIIPAMAVLILLFGAIFFVISAVAVYASRLGSIGGYAGGPCSTVCQGAFDPSTGQKAKYEDKSAAWPSNMSTPQKQIDWVRSTEGKTYATTVLGIPATDIRHYTKPEVENMIRAEVASQFPNLPDPYKSTVEMAQRALLTYQVHEDGRFDLLEDGTSPANRQWKDWPSYTTGGSGHSTNILSLTDDKFTGFGKNKRVAASYDIHYVIYLGVQEHMGKFSASHCSGLTDLKRWRCTLEKVSSPAPMWNPAAETAWKHYENETPYACDTATIGSGASATTTQKITREGKEYTIPDGGAGGISAEDHLLTKDDPLRRQPVTQWTTTYGDPPKTIRHSREGLADHFRVTNIAQQCPECNTDPKKSEWTPAEGDGDIGQGSRLALGQVPTAHEPWIMNARWTTLPPAGTKVIITAKKTGKSVVAVAGYETGPGAETNNNAGAQKEVLARLGIGHKDQVTFGFASDQSLTPGTVFTNGVSSDPCIVGDNNATISGNTIVIDSGHNSNYNPFRFAIDGFNNEGDHNWFIAQKLKNILVAKGFHVLFTKQSAAEKVGLPERVAFANKNNAGFYISLHSNAGGGQGPMGLVFCSGTPDNKSVDYHGTDSCATSVLGAQSRSASRHIVAKVQSTFSFSRVQFDGGELGMLNGLKMPGFVIEMFAHDESVDLNKVKGRGDQMAQAIADGISEVMKK